MDTICPKVACTGCFACMNICPKLAITKGEDELSKTIPVIDKEKCIDCGLCQKVCPQNKDGERNYPKICYAMQTKNEDDKERSSSGGVGAGFSRQIIENGGVVFGAGIDNDANPVMIKAEDEEEIKILRGSKYVQCFVGDTYKEAKKWLMAGKRVLYTGTPCQIDGLLSFLGKDYDNLITVDLVCHGTPPAKHLKEYENEVCNKKPDKVSFRGENNWFLTFYKGEEILYKKYRDIDFYFYSFLEALTYRDNCYNCRYANPERCSDITIGDFWGIDRKTLKNIGEGRISLCLINTDKGKEFFDEIKDSFIYEERAIDEAISGNYNLYSPSKPHKDRAVFEAVYKKQGFIKAVKTPIIKKEIKSNYIKDIIGRGKRKIIRTYKALKRR